MPNSAWVNGTSGLTGSTGRLARFADKTGSTTAALATTSVTMCPRGWEEDPDRTAVFVTHDHVEEYARRLRAHCDRFLAT